MMALQLIVFVVLRLNSLSATETVTIPEGESRNLQCSPNHVLDISSASYKGNSLLCSPTDVTSKVKAMCQEMPFCKVKATDKVFKDSCLFFKELLTIRFTCEEIYASTVPTSSNFNTTSSTDRLTSDKGGNDTIGIVIGCLFGIVILVILTVAFIIFRSKHRKKGESTESEHFEIIPTNSVRGLDISPGSTGRPVHHPTPMCGYENGSYGVNSTACRFVHDNTISKVAVDNMYSVSNMSIPPPSYDLVRENSYPVNDYQSANNKGDPLTDSNETGHVSSNKNTHSVQCVSYDIPNTEFDKSNAGLSIYEERLDYDTPCRSAVGYSHVHGPHAKINPHMDGISTYVVPVKQELRATNENIYVNQDFGKSAVTDENNSSDLKPLTSNMEIQNYKQYVNIECRNKSRNVDNKEENVRNQRYMPMLFGMKSVYSAHTEEDMYVPIMSPSLVDTQSKETYQY